MMKRILVIIIATISIAFIFIGFFSSNYGLINLGLAIGVILLVINFLFSKRDT